MHVKIDTKEKFTVITPTEANITANMTGELEILMLKHLDNAIPHVILNMKSVETINKEAGERIAATQEQFYEKNCSFVICEVNKNIQTLFEEGELLDILNITPSESEAWDIVQMEEIEREMMGDFDKDEND